VQGDAPLGPKKLIVNPVSRIFEHFQHGTKGKHRATFKLNVARNLLPRSPNYPVLFAKGMRECRYKSPETFSDFYTW